MELFGFWGNSKIIFGQFETIGINASLKGFDRTEQRIRDIQEQE